MMLIIIKSMNNEDIILDLESKRKKILKKNILVITISLFILILIFFVSLFVGSSFISFKDCFLGLFGKSSESINKIVQNIRLPRAIAATCVGGTLSLSGLIMQTTMNNDMAFPSTLGVSNAATFGANIAIIIYAGGFVSIGHNADQILNYASPYLTSVFAFAFAFGSTLIVLLLCKIRNFNPTSVVLAGLAIGAFFTALTTIVQYYATDVGLSSAVIWSFGDLSKATTLKNVIIAIVLLASFIYFFINSKKYNCLLNGDEVAKSLGVNVNLLRFISLLISSLLTAISVSFFGIIGFVGIICPHTMKRIIGSNHYVCIPCSVLCGSILLLSADILSRVIANGSALPVGAITSLLGAPFFLYLIFFGRNKQNVIS